MGLPSPVTPNCANPRTEQVFGGRRTGLRTNSVVMLHAHSLWPAKTAARVAEITGYSSRAVENWDAERARIPGDALAALLQSEWGRGFLAAVMADAQPSWWMKLKAFFNALDVMTMQRATRRKLKEALDADAAFSPPHAALFQDEEFYSAQPSPARAVDRTVVARRLR
jgi:hypothetical protein